MKKKYLLGLFIVLSLIVAGCGGSGEKKESVKGNNSENVQKKDKTSEENIKVDKKQLDAEITLPTFLTQGADPELLSTALDEGAKEQGIKEVVVNEDGSVTYIMSRESQEEAVEEMGEAITDMITALVDDNELGSIKEIKVNKTFDKYQVIVDREQFEKSLESIGVFSLAMTATFYHIFDGASEGEYEIVVEYVDSKTNQVFDKGVYPKEWEKLTDFFGDSLGDFGTE